MKITPHNFVILIKLYLATYADEASSITIQDKLPENERNHTNALSTYKISVFNVDHSHHGYYSYSKIWSKTCPVLILDDFIFYSKKVYLMLCSSSQRLWKALTHFSTMSHFYTPWKRQKTYGYEVLVPDDENLMTTMKTLVGVKKAKLMMGKVGTKERSIVGIALDVSTNCL